MNKALFLDRDGIVNKIFKKYNKFYKKVLDDSPFEISELKFNGGVRELTEFAAQKGYVILIVTNQPSVITGNMSILNYELITTEICKHLGLKRSQVFECFHKEGITSECDCRKPKPGLFLMAKGMFDINMDDSIMVGDSHTDILAAKRAGINKTVFLRRKKSDIEDGNKGDEEKMIELNIKPSFIINNLNEIIERELI